MSTTPLVWLAAGMTLAMISFMFFPDNKVYRLAQSAFVGVAAGNAIVVGWQNLQSQAIKPLTEGQWIFLVPLILGALFYARFIPGLHWVSRYPLALLVATGAGVGLAGAVQAQFLTQVSATFVKLNNLDNIILFGGVIAVICYFFMTKGYTQRMGSVGQHVTTLGRWVMMIGFGTTFGNAVMGRCSLLIARLQFLLGDWLGLAK